MEDLVAALSRPDAYPPGVGAVQTIETHTAWVFLTEAWAYKVKKPVDFGFLDYSTIARRRHFCDEEVRLNAVFAPDVYQGVVPIDSALRMEGPGPVVEWAVKMRRLPDDATVLARLASIERADIERVADHIARLHATADRGPHTCRWTTASAVSHNARENFAQTADHVGTSVHPAVWTRVRDATEALIDDLAETFMARVPLARETHGDLRAEHIYLMPEGILILDGVEFSERLRYADPASDIAFLAMDLAVHGRADLSDALLERWIAASDDAGARTVLPFYQAYRSVVRAKVRAYQGRHDLARRHWGYALSHLSRPGTGPALVGMGGLPGTGKSTVARALADAAGFTVIRTDAVRKELAGLRPEDAAAAPWGEGLYTASGRARVYEVCLQRAAARLAEGGRVLVDGSFSTERWRTALLDIGLEAGVPTTLLWCEVPASVARERLAARVDDPSDADANIHHEAAARWEAASVRTARHLIRLSTAGDLQDVVRRALAAIGTGRGSGPGTPVRQDGSAAEPSSSAAP